jgi:hypothetical protein
MNNKTIKNSMHQKKKRNTGWVQFGASSGDLQKRRLA